MLIGGSPPLRRFGESALRWVRSSKCKSNVEQAIFSVRMKGWRPPVIAESGFEAVVDFFVTDMTARRAFSARHAVYVRQNIKSFKEFLFHENCVPEWQGGSSRPGDQPGPFPPPQPASEESRILQLKIELAKQEVAGKRLSLKLDLEKEKTKQIEIQHAPALSEANAKTEIARILAEVRKSEFESGRGLKAIENGQEHQVHPESPESFKILSLKEKRLYLEKYGSPPPLKMDGTVIRAPMDNDNQQEVSQQNTNIVTTCVISPCTKIAFWLGCCIVRCC